MIERIRFDREVSGGRLDSNGAEAAVFQVESGIEDYRSVERELDMAFLLGNGGQDSTAMSQAEA